MHNYSTSVYDIKIRINEAQSSEELDQWRAATMDLLLQAWLHAQASGPMRARRHGAAINRMVKEDQQMVAANPSASISFNHASAEDAKVPELAPQIKMEDLHVVEAMDQDAVSEPLTADGMERHINLCSH